jgi:hypothetical protein
VALKIVGDAVEAASPQEVVRSLAIRLAHDVDYHTFDVSPNGQRILVLQRVLTSDTATVQLTPELPTPGLTVVMNWASGSKKK